MSNNKLVTLLMERDDITRREAMMKIKEAKSALILAKLTHPAAMFPIMCKRICYSFLNLEPDYGKDIMSS